jgi:hypothetical protein
MKKRLILLFLTALVSACSPADAPITNLPATDTESPVSSKTPDQGISEMPFNPLPGDIKLQRGNVFISESGLVLRESFPVQVVLGLSGELPTPCHQLRVHIEPPDAENKILIEAYTVVNPEINCIQVLKPFTEMVELGTFPGGQYTVWVNGEQVGEFDT